MGRRGLTVGIIGVLCLVGLCCGAGCVGGFLLLGGRYQSCVPGRPGGITVEDLAGRYVTTQGAQLVFNASGTFTAQNVTIEFANKPMTLEGSGTWSLLPTDDGFGDIHLGFDEARFSTYLSISGSRTKPWLYWYIGDPDSCQIQRFDRA